MEEQINIESVIATESTTEADIDIYLKPSSGFSLVNDFRNIMVRFLVEAHRMIQRWLAEADFEEAFPHIFGHPHEENVTVSARNEWGLLLRKGELHVSAVLRAHNSSNLHSLAVHMRNVLECAAQVLSTAHEEGQGTAREFARILNRSEYEFQDIVARLSQGSIDCEQIQDMIIHARARIKQSGTKRPKKVNVADKISILPDSIEWYDFLSVFFCHSDASVLTGDSFCGGVVSIDKEADEVAFAVFLDYLTEQVISMLFGYGFLLIAENGDSQPFDEAHLFLKRKRASARQFRQVVWQRKESK